MQLALRGEGRARVFIFVETIGVSTDMRAVEGLQEQPAYPQIGLAVFEGAGSPNPLKQPPPNGAHWVAPAASDGVHFIGELAAGCAPHVLMPHLGPEAAGVPENADLKLVLTVYSDMPIELDAVESDWSCEKCSQNGRRRKCPYQAAIEQMEAVEAVMDQRLALLDSALHSARW